MASTENKTPTPNVDIKILIATPCYSGECYTGYALSLVRTYFYFQQFKNIKLLHHFINYDASVARARNHYAAFTLADPSITHLLFIDADMSWEPEDIYKLLKHNKPIVGGAIPKKKYNWEKLRTPKLREIIMNDALTPEEFRQQVKASLVDYAAVTKSQLDVKEGLVEAEKVGTAFMLIQREALEKLCLAFPMRKILNPWSHFEPKIKENLYSLFDQECKNGEYLSTSYSFCRLWQSIGGKVYLDVTTRFTHQGHEDFTGSFSNLISK